MLHESDNENHEDEHDMGDDFDLDDAVLWGEEGGSDDDSGQDNEMESDEDGEGEDNEPDAPPQLAFNADGRPVLWNLGQLGALCVPARCFALCLRAEILSNLSLQSQILSCWAVG